MSYSASFNVCGVDFSEPWVAVKNSAGQDVMVIDKDGDFYAAGEDHTLDNIGTQSSLVVGNTHFNSITSKYQSVNTFQSDISTVQQGIRVKTGSPGGPNTDVALISGTGGIYSQGNAAVEGGQAACAPDGSYCAGDIVQTRDYFCNILGDKIGACQYSVSASTNCNILDDSPTCLGDTLAYQNYGCSSGVCEVSSYTGLQNCNINDGTYCSGSTLQTRDYSCGGSSCTYTVTGSSSCSSGCSGSPGSAACNVCVPESSATTCSGTCDWQTNNCGSSVYCGACAPPPSCEDSGQIGTWPACYDPPTCADFGMEGSYPDCFVPEPDPTCADLGMEGSYPDCTPIVVCNTCDCPGYPACAPPPTCADFGMEGSYPDCFTPPPPTCEDFGLVGSYPDCTVSCVPNIVCEAECDNGWFPGCSWEIVCVDVNGC